MRSLWVGISWMENRSARLERHGNDITRTRLNTQRRHVLPSSLSASASNADARDIDSSCKQSAAATQSAREDPPSSSAPAGGVSLPHV